MPVYLLANKVDIKDHCVPSEQGQEIAQKYNVPFFETSAKENINVRETFYQIAESQIKKL